VGFIAYLHCLRAEMPSRCKQTFPREEKCLLDHLSPFWDLPLSVLQSFKSHVVEAMITYENTFFPLQSCFV
jgi:hypothetical protein